MARILLPSTEKIIFLIKVNSRASTPPDTLRSVIKENVAEGLFSRSRKRLFCKGSISVAGVANVANVVNVAGTLLTVFSVCSSKYAEPEDRLNRKKTAIPAQTAEHFGKVMDEFVKILYRFKKKIL